MRTVHSDRQLRSRVHDDVRPPAGAAGIPAGCRPAVRAGAAITGCRHTAASTSRPVRAGGGRTRPGRIVFADRIAARPVLVLQVRGRPLHVRTGAPVTVGNDCSLVRCSAGSRPEAIATAAACTGVRRSMASTSIRCPSCHAPARFWKPPSALAFRPAAVPVPPGARARFPPVRSPADSASP